MKENGGGESVLQIFLGLLALVAAVFALVCVVAWLYAMTRWDKQGGCDESQCDSCPFPCEKHDNTIKFD